MLRALASIATVVLLLSAAHAADPALLGVWGVRHQSATSLAVTQYDYAVDGTYTSTTVYTGSLDTLFAYSYPTIQLPIQLGDAVYTYTFGGTWDAADGAYSCTAAVTEVSVNGVPLAQFIPMLVEGTAAQQAEAAGLSSEETELLGAQLAAQFDPLVAGIPALIASQQTFTQTPYSVDDEVLFIVTEPETDRGILLFRDLTRTGVAASTWGSLKAMDR
jgi:hypothetical protein